MELCTQSEFLPLYSKVVVSKLSNVSTKSSLLALSICDENVAVSNSRSISVVVAIISSNDVVELDKVVDDIVVDVVDLKIANEFDFSSNNLIKFQGSNLKGLVATFWQLPCLHICPYGHFC